VLVGGAASSRRLLVAAHERGLPVLTTYGLTEACAQVATRRYAERYEPPPPDGASATIGVALPGVELRVVDDVLELRGPTLFSGYAGVPESDPKGGWFRTGDRANLTARGELVLHGRVSDVIITGGENVDPVEVEAALEALPGVAEACVVGLPDATFGEIVAAAYVPRQSALDYEGVIRELRTRLAPYKVPRVLVPVATFARLSSGKIDRRSVHADLAAANAAPE
jgi:O-succinylbenzoic acid--CoA ligase